MITYKIHLLRHGKTTGPQGEIYTGRRDLPLSAEGTRELEALAAGYVYPPVGRVFCGPLGRCTASAALLYPGHAPTVLAAFNECDFGDFTGRPLAALQKSDAYHAWLAGGIELAPPGGESGRMLLERAAGGLGEVLATMSREKITDAAIVTHGGVIMSLLAACGYPKKPMREWFCPHGQGFTLRMTPQLWMRDSVFEVISHLPWLPE